MNFFFSVVKKVYTIVWYDKFTNPLRLSFKSYFRYKRGGWNEVYQQLKIEYNQLMLNKSNNKIAYKKWIKLNEKDILKTEKLLFNPLVSIITPTYNTEKKYLLNMIESVLSQTYSNWELCIADDSSTLEETKRVLNKYESNKKIKIIYREKNGHISKASNSALDLSSGEYVVFLDHDDMLAPNALYEMIKKLNKNRNLKLIYSDEDKIDVKNRRYDPHFKSGWNPDMFFSQNYITHLTFIKKDIVDKIGGFRVGYEGSQDYDLLLRSLKYIKDKEIDRVEKILYHWRAIEGSTALNSQEKSYTTKAGIKALKDYFKSIYKDVTVRNGLLDNTYKVKYNIQINILPLVSIIIPTRDKYEILKKCIESILEKTIYSNYEIIVIDNQSKEEKTFKYLKNLQKKYNNIRVISYNHPFNYSAINNFGVKHANGDIVGLLNNDVEVINKGWLTEMVQHALRPEIGAVGAKLYYENNTIQHAGVILGIGGIAGHSHKYFNKDAYGYFSRLKIVQNYSAVTGACLIVRKNLFEEVGGLEENLKVAFNDVDFCLKIAQNGYRNIWTPYAELYHHESISRGKDDSLEKKERAEKEIYYMKYKWKSLLKDDLYYNRNLSNQFEDFRLLLKVI